MAFWVLISIFIFPVAITISVLIGALFGSLELDGNMFSIFVLVLIFVLAFLFSIEKNFRNFWKSEIQRRNEEINLLVG